MLLYDIKTKQIVEDAEEQKTKIKNLSIWHHSEGKPIAFSTDLEEKGYKLLSEDAPEIIKARYEKEKELKSKLSKERNEKDKEALRMKEAEEQRIKVEMARELYLKTIIPKGNQMPIWFNKYAQSLQINKGKQDRIRQTYTYSKREWIDYFASSFPSTFLAGYKIVSNLLENKIINEKYAKKTTIKIADIGCGSGGATIGTITAINQLLPNIENIELDAYDYSKDALAIFANCLNAYPNQKFNKLKLSQEVKFVPKHSDEDPNMYTFEEFEKKLLSNKNYDFILCFKMVNELISPLNKQGFDEGTYYNVVQIATKHISDNGFFILLDVSLSNEKDEFGNAIDNTEYAILLNNGINKFLYRNNNYKCIIPIPCAIVSTCEAKRCWIQRLVKSEDGREFPAAYKVLTKKQFGNSIIEKISKEDTSKYIINERKKNETNTKIFKRCFYQNGKMTRSEEITKEEINNYKNGFCI